MNRASLALRTAYRNFIAVFLGILEGDCVGAQQVRTQAPMDTKGAIIRSLSQ